MTRKINSFFKEYDDCLYGETKLEGDFIAKIIITKKPLNGRNRDELNSILSKYGFSWENLKKNKQTHTNKVTVRDIASSGEPEADAIVTSDVNTPVLILTADCVPIVVIDKKKNIIANIHSGWRGTFGKISYEAIRTMESEYECSPEDMISVIGPSAGPCCYEVSRELVDKFITDEYFNDEKYKSSFYLEKGEKVHLDLWNLNEYILLKSGILNENLLNLKICTNCCNDRFFSYRFENHTDGRIATVVELQKI